MSRWINADALFAEFENVGWYNNADRDEIAERLVLQASTIDFVRCAECKKCKRRTGTFKGEPIFFYRCEENGRDVESDDYCSWGERRE